MPAEWAGWPVQVRWQLERPMYNFKNFFSSAFVYIHRAKYIFFQRHVLPTPFLSINSRCDPNCVTLLVNGPLPHPESFHTCSRHCACIYLLTSLRRKDLIFSHVHEMNQKSFESEKSQAFGLGF